MYVLFNKTNENFNFLLLVLQQILLSNNDGGIQNKMPIQNRQSTPTIMVIENKICFLFYYFLLSSLNQLGHLLQQTIIQILI